MVKNDPPPVCHTAVGASIITTHSHFLMTAIDDTQNFFFISIIADDWRCDQYRWVSVGVHRLPKTSTSKWTLLLDSANCSSAMHTSYCATHSIRWFITWGIAQFMRVSLIGTVLLKRELQDISVPCYHIWTPLNSRLWDLSSLLSYIRQRWLVQT